MYTLNKSLPSTDLPLVYRHPLNHLINALPYFDEPSENVQYLINQEMRNLEPKDYLVELPMPKLKYSSLIEAEMQRISEGQPMEKLIFTPPVDLEDQNPRTYQEASNQVEIQMQNSSIKQINLELLSKYGQDAWKNLLASQEKEKQRLEKELEKLKLVMNEINSLRKFEQYEVQQKIDNYKHRISEMKSNTQELELECQDLDLKITQMRKKKMKLE